MDETSRNSLIRLRHYGNSGRNLILLHGGPGAPGYVAPIGRALADRFRVIEPFQRASGGEPLTVARHTADLLDVVHSCPKPPAPALLGHSWGAMLTLAYGSRYPGTVSALVLISCGTFDAAARDRMNALRAARISERGAGREARLLAALDDANERLAALGTFFQKLDSVDLIPHRDETEAFDARGYDETWADVLRLQREGVHPAAFGAIREPVLMLHGADDPHPGDLTRDTLKALMPQIEYHQFPRCGHYPWLERAARDDFFAVLREWLQRTLD